MSLSFTSIQQKDLPKVLEIYNYYVLNSTATFHLSKVNENEICQFLPVGDQKYKSFLVLDNNVVCGFCYLSPLRKKAGYDISAEITLYLNKNYTNKGIGKKVLFFLEDIAKNNDIKNLVAIITEENKDSISLFKKYGYFKCGHLKNIGVKFNKTIDVFSFQKEI